MCKRNKAYFYAVTIGDLKVLTETFIFNRIITILIHWNERSANPKTVYLSNFKNMKI